MRKVLMILVYAAIAFGDSKLVFNPDGTFKLAQFADIHYANGELTRCVDISPNQRPCNDLNSTRFIGKVLDSENIDLGVFTGDNISGPFRAEDAIKAYAEPAFSRQIPWAMVFGNHDEEADLDREEMMLVTLSLPFTITERGPTDVFGVGNYAVQLLDPQGNNVFNLYFLDSGDYSKNPNVRGYEWIRPSQINFYLEKARQFKEANGGNIVPALMFYHIPIPEYDQVSAFTGEKQEGVYSANVNSGLFSALLEAGDVIATFVGHDHINDFCGIYQGIFLCYGGGVGYNAYGKEGWDRRSRVIEISHNGKKVTTWKRLDNSGLTKKDEQILYDASL